MNHKVLITDDEKPVRIAISKLGSWAKYHIDPPVYAENGKDALKAVFEIHPSIVFVDIEMPIMNGIEFLKQVYGTQEKCGFIVISGYDDFSYAQSAIRYGVTDYLLKPVIPDDLNGAIDKIMRRLYPDEDFNKEQEDSALSAEQVVELIHHTIDKNYSEDIGIQDFADRYFFSKEYLSRLFKSEYKTGIYEYLTDTRMKRAEELLCDPDIKITDIAARVGYPDNNYFSKAFRKYCGMRPSEFRKAKS